MSGCSVPGRCRPANEWRRSFYCLPFLALSAVAVSWRRASGSTVRAIRSTVVSISGFLCGCFCRFPAARSAARAPCSISRWAAASSRARPTCESMIFFTSKFRPGLTSHRSRWPLWCAQSVSAVLPLSSYVRPRTISGCWLSFRRRPPIICRNQQPQPCLPKADRAAPLSASPIILHATSLDRLFPGGRQGIFRRQPLVLGEIVWFDRQVARIERFGAGLRGEEIDQGLRLVFGGKPAEPIFRHRGRRMPEGQFNRASLVDAQGLVPHLKSTWLSGRPLER